MAIYNEIREKIIEAYIEKRMFKKDIACMFGVKRTTVYAILKVYLKEGRSVKKTERWTKEKDFKSGIC